MSSVPSCGECVHVRECVPVRERVRSIGGCVRSIGGCVRSIVGCVDV